MATKTAAAANSKLVAATSRVNELVSEAESYHEELKKVMLSLTNCFPTACKAPLLDHNRNCFAC
jgi:hypothetical protein